MDPHFIPGYELIEKIGEGSMGTVYKARQVSLGRLVAIKILRPELVNDPTARAQFKLEANSVATLKHPNILMLHEAGQRDGTHFFVMEYVSAYSVHDWLNRKHRLSESDALTIADAVAQALLYAWERGGLIHCDLKPDNLLVDEDGMVKVADFSGLSRTRTTPEARLVGEMTIGTPNYMAPEQVHGIDDLDHRTDIYSLGIVLYQLLTGRLPFSQLSPEEIMQRQVSSYLPDPRETVPDLSAGMVQVMEHMLAKDRGQRYATWQEVTEDLALVRAGQTPRRPPPVPGSSTLRRSAHFSRGTTGSSSDSAAPPHGRRRGLTGLLLIALGLIVLNAVLLLLLWQAERLPFSSATRAEHSDRTIKVNPQPQTPEPAEIPVLPDLSEPSETPPVVPDVSPEAEAPSSPPEEQVVAPEPPEPESEHPRPQTASLSEFSDVLAVHRSALEHTQQFDFARARTLLTEWIQTHPDHPFSKDVTRSIERLNEAISLRLLVQQRSEPLMGLHLPSFPGNGTITAVRPNGFRVRRVLGPGGVTESLIEFSALDAEDFLMMFRAIHAEHPRRNTAVLLLAQGRFSAARPFLQSVPPNASPSSELQAWATEWQEMAQNLTAQRMVVKAEELLKRNLFTEAQSIIQSIFDRFSDTRLVREYYEEDLRSWQEIATEELSW